MPVNREEDEEASRIQRITRILRIQTGDSDPLDPLPPQNPRCLAAFLANHLALGNSRWKFAEVAAATSSMAIPRNSATFAATSATNAGSFRLPRCGTGVK